MSEITLSKAVRSNLLNLQSTADLLSKSQERLSTGLRVNSALDNPTNFFTAQGLNSRASDLSQLLDAVSNAVQTVAAADKGISAITKLVESAQATARQALQTAATVTTTGAADAGTVTGGAFTTLNVSGTGAAAGSATRSSTGFAAVDLSAAGQVATQSSITAAGTFTDVDLTNDAGDALTFDVSLGADTVNITLDRSADGDADNIIDIDEAIAAIQSQLDAFNAGAGLGVTVGKDLAGTSLTFTANTAGATALTVDNIASVDGDGLGGSNQTTADLGITVVGGQTDTGDALIAADSISFSLTVGATTQTITLDSSIAAVDPSAVTADEIATAINTQFGSNVVDGSSGELEITDSALGTGSVVTVGTITTTGNGNSLGLTAGTTNGTAAGSADSLSFTITRDGGSPTTITISDATVDAYNTANGATLDSSALSAANVASIINYQAGATVASVTTGGALQIASTTTGTSSSIATGAVTSTATSGSIGFTTAQSDTGAASSTTTTPNPKRAELVETYNDLLGQIDALAKDSGFNGVNLLNGDNLSVLFNEDGSSKLDIAGITNTSAGLGLTALLSDGFDSNASINSTLDGLKGAIDTLRTQASKFGSNLSVVETRQDFTKQMINVLQTGASNLTLADTNEEAANVLALQTRQQLSSTALSLASQADQNVLRLF